MYGAKELVNVPVIGKITAGEPILAVENITDIFPIPVDFVGNSETFMLRVRGESMIEAGIFDGDYIVDEKAHNATLTPRGAKKAEAYFSVENIIKELDLRRPIYASTVNYGHFGKAYLPWEQAKTLK